MTPLSPLYFIKQNKARCILLMFMIFLSFGAYLGGLYIYTPQQNWDYPIERDAEMVEIYCGNTSGAADKYMSFCEEIRKRDDIILIEEAWYNQINRKTVMGFEDGSFCYSFRTADDFKLFCGHHNIECDFSKVKPKTIVLSKLMADKVGCDVGSVIAKGEGNNFEYDFTVAAITDEPAYTQYYICKEDETNYDALLLGKGISAEEVRSHAISVAKEYPVIFSTPLQLETEEMYSIFNTIFMVVVVFLAIILSITVNAAFVGMYQRREFEFAVYRAIGISKKKLIRKIAGEIIIMDLTVLIIGGVIFFLGLYLFNELVLIPNGLYLVYTAPIAVVALVLCNILTIIPLIISRSRALLKTDVCDY